MDVPMAEGGHSLDEGCDHPKEYWRYRRPQDHDHRLKLPAEPLIIQSKSGLRPKNPTNWAAGGPGMQAIFLDSGRRSCGTGVFLPSKKPACSPVLLPSRVVQALNLDVHELGVQIKPQRDENFGAKKKGKDTSKQCCVISQNRSSSPEIFLPKEWTY